jgi:uncharacterized damage-inducible protein DinB
VSRADPMNMAWGAREGLQAHFEILARYNRWANARLYDAIAVLGDEPLRRDVGLFFGNLHRTLNHILLADRIWLFRLTCEQPEQGPPGRVLHDDFAALARARIETDERLIRIIDNLPAGPVADIVRFRMMNGLDVQTSVTAVLSHLFNHQAHHRGQAHSALTILGAGSVELDLLLFELERGAGSRFPAKRDH